GYSERTVIATKITAPANAAAGKVTINADIKWLSCKDICLPGGTSASLEVPVSSSGVQPANQDVFTNVGFNGSVEELTGGDTKEHGADTKTNENLVSSGGSILDESINVQGEEKTSQDPLFYLGFAMLGGFILNFMPCVLPVISIKILSFVQQADEEPKRVRLLGLTFSAGIVSAFLVLATVVLVVRRAGQSVGWGFQFQYPGFVIIMCVIVLLLALSLFGLFYVSFSAGQDKLDNLASKEGFLGTFFKGVLATTLSTPCTAPFLGTALGFAFAQPEWVVLGIFFASGLGMSMPYILLTLNPGWMKFMPKPGVWMEKFKESMGFILLATVIWLLSVLGSQIGTQGVMWTSFFLLTVALSSWIVSRYTDLTSTTKRKTVVWSIASLVTLAGFFFFVYQQPSVVLALDPTHDTQAKEPTGTTEWKPFSIEALDEAIRANKTVLLDFTADWCLTCKLNEKAVLSTKPVEDKLKELKIVTIKADWTRQDPMITKLLRKFNRSGVPLYVIFPSGKSADPIVLPEVITQDLVLSALDKAGPSKP
ncbi:MAG: thioredoxin family protein, partial [Cyanobacteria bacterium]|nr:thioredoxin family protein [Cyanobacteriota bacterium]